MEPSREDWDEYMEETMEQLGSEFLSGWIPPSPEQRAQARSKILDNVRKAAEIQIGCPCVAQFPMPGQPQVGVITTGPAIDYGYVRWWLQLHDEGSDA